MTTAIILAAGAGAKVWPFSEVRNKCALPVLNVPLVRRLADGLRRVGFREVAVVVGHQAASVKAAFVDDPGVRFLEPPRTAWPHCAGTAGAALAGVRELPSDDGWLVVSGDLVLGDDSLRALKQRFEHARPLAAALVHPLGTDQPQDWLCCETRDDRLTAVEGHSRDFGQRLCGAYALSPRALRYLECNPGLFRHVPVGGMPPLEAELAESLAMMVDAGEEVLTAPTASPLFIDVDKPWHILEANRRLFDEQIAQLDGDQIAATARVAESAEISGRVVLGKGAVIGPRCVVEGGLMIAEGGQVTNGVIVRGGCVVGRGALVRDYAQVAGAVIGARCVVGHGAEFSGVMFDGAYLYHYCEVFGVVGESVDIGAATVCGTLRFDDQNTQHLIRGRRETPMVGANATYFGDFSRTGVNAVTMPGVKIGARSIVGAGVVLYEDLPSGKIITVKQDLQVKDWGPARHGW